MVEVQNVPAVSAAHEAAKRAGHAIHAQGWVFIRVEGAQRIAPLSPADQLQPFSSVETLWRWE